MRPLWKILAPAAHSPHTILTCDECFVALEYLIDLAEAVIDPQELWHVAQRHLARCPDCRERHLELIRELESLVFDRHASRES